jgi:hypothetical protein
MDRDDKAETILDQFCMRRLYPHSRLFNGVEQQSEDRRVSFKTEWVDAMPGCCMFATGLITADAVGRVCELTDCFCPPGVFKNPKVFQNCSSRVDVQEKQQPRRH